MSRSGSVSTSVNVSRVGRVGIVRRATINYGGSKKDNGN